MATKTHKKLSITDRLARRDNAVANSIKWNRPGRGFELRAANVVLGRFHDKDAAATAARKLERQGIKVEVWVGDDVWSAPAA